MYKWLDPNFGKKNSIFVFEPNPFLDFLLLPEMEWRVRIELKPNLDD